MVLLTLRTAFWHTYRAVFYLKLMHKTRRFVLNNAGYVRDFFFGWNLVKNFKEMTLLTMVLAAVQYYILSLLLDLVLSYAMKIHPLSSFDEFWLTDNGQDSWGYSYFWPSDTPEMLDEPGDGQSQLKNICYLMKVEKTNI